MTNKERFTAILREMLEQKKTTAGAVAAKLEVHKDTVYAWKGTNEKRWVSEKTATTLLPALITWHNYISRPEEYLTSEPQTQSQPQPEVQAPAADRFEVFQPEQTEQTITVKQLAEILAITPKSLRRCLRKKYGKAQDGVWTLTLTVVEEIKAVFTAKT